MQATISKFNKTTQTLQQNQNVLKSRISEIEHELESIQIEHSEMNRALSIQTILFQITTALQIINDIFNKLETAISFAKTKIFHNAIIEPSELLKEIKAINSYIKNAKLPFKPKLSNVLLFEKILEVKSYVKLNRIVFLIEIPIVEKESYNYFHLYSLPVSYNDMYKIILPSSKYLILNEHYFSHLERECQEAVQGEFLCEANPTEIKGSNIPCEIELLKFSEKPKTCNQEMVQVTSPKIQSIENGRWIAVIPERIIGVQQCEEGKESIPLKGTYLIELPHRCRLKLGNTELKTYQDNGEKIKWIRIPNLNVSLPSQKETAKFNHKPAELATIDLDEFKHIQHTLDRQRDSLEETSELPIHFHKASFWTILLYALIIIFICSVTHVYLKKRKNKKPNPNEKPTSSTQNVTLDELRIQKHPSMFSN